MYVEEATEKTSSNTSAVDAMPVGVGINVTEEVTPCFIKYLLRERYVGMCAIGLLLKQLQT